MWYILLACIPAALFALGNHIDKHLIDKYFKDRDIGSLVLFSSFIGIPITLALAVIVPGVFDIPWQHALLLVCNGMLFLCSIIPYFYALGYDETSIVTPLYQMTPVIAAVLGFFFLGETLLPMQLLGGLLIMGGSIFLSLEFEEKIRLKKKVFLLMTLTATLTAVNVLLFRLVSTPATFWISAFWEYLGFVVFGVGVFSLHKPFRTQFLHVLKTNTAKMLGLNGFNEFIIICAKTTLHYGTLFIPISLMLWLSEGLQPFFVLILGVCMTIFFPKFATENISKGSLAHKVTALAVMFLGMYFLSNGFSL